MNPLAQVARRVTLKELRLLLAVSRSGSILKAASEIGMTQPALSKAISELEATLGVRLFDRTNRGVCLTPHGDVLARRATGVFEELRQAGDELQSLTEADRGELRLGGTPAMCAGALPHVIAAVRLHRPRFTFQITELESARLASEVAARSLDLGIGRKPAGSSDELEFEPLFEDPLCIVAGAQHPLASKKSVKLKETALHPWTLPSGEEGVAAHLDAEFRRQGVSLPSPAVTTMSMLVRSELVAAHDHLTVMYGSVLRFGRLPGSLRVLPVDLPIGIPVGLIRSKNRTLAPSAEVFIQVLRDAVSPMQAMKARHLARKTPGPATA